MRCKGEFFRFYLNKNFECKILNGQSSQIFVQSNFRTARSDVPTIEEMRAARDLVYSAQGENLRVANVRNARQVRFSAPKFVYLKMVFIF